MTNIEVTVENSVSDVASPVTWFERHGDYLYSFAFIRVRHAESAEDLVQDSLLAAWKNRAEFNHESSERTWLTAILKRKVIDFLRRRIREQVTSQPQTDQFVTDLFDRRGEWKTRPGRWNRDSVETLDREAFWMTTRDCLSKLPPRLHDVFVLRYLDNVAAEQVCQEMQITSSNLWVMLHRARVRMWWCLSKNWFQEDPHSQEQDQ
ncbi:sigma-70 family RNA polymerase sigma factor [Lacunimicrobium album]